MKKTGWLTRLLLDWVLICVGVLGSLYCMTTAFGFAMPGAIPVLVLVLALFFCLLFVGKPGKFYALGVLGLFLLAGWLLRQELTEGLRNLWGSLCAFYVKGYDLFRGFQPREYDPKAIGFGLAVLAVFETYLCALAVRLWRRTAPAALALLPGIAACFVLTDTPPGLLPLLAAVLSVLTQAFSQSARRRETREQAKAVGLAALLSAALLGLLLLCIPRESYKPPITWEDLTRKLERWGEEQNNRGNVNAGLAGNPQTVDLTNLGALPNRPVPVLYVTSAKSAYLYLRGMSYAGFNGSRWSIGPVWQGSQEVLYPYLRRSDGVNLSIETRYVENVLYTTYQPIRLPEEGTAYADAYVENTGEADRYAMRYLIDPKPVIPDEAYDAWVRENCLKLPEQTRATVLAWWEANGGEFSALSSADPELSFSVVGDEGENYLITHYSIVSGTDRDEYLLSYARNVAQKISQVARYSRDPARMPEGEEDFCAWFLNEAEEGYCVHYATACTALLRALDIPARYVSGYVCEAEGGERTRVTNLQAHAWVEIWTGGRWVVVEPTPDDATEFTGEVPSSGNTPGGQTEPSQTTEPPTAPPLPTKPTAPETGPSEGETSEPPETTEPRGGGGTAAEPKDRTVLWIILGIAGFILLALGRRELTLRLRERRLVRTKGNDRARLLYRRILRLHRLGGGPVSPEVTELASKAAFSQHALDDKELAYLRQIYEQQRSRLGIAGFWKRFWCKYVLAVI